jgi:hypothetical protein
MTLSPLMGCFSVESFFTGTSIHDPLPDAGAVAHDQPLPDGDRVEFAET